MDQFPELRQFLPRKHVFLWKDTLLLASTSFDQVFTFIITESYCSKEEGITEQNAVENEKKNHRRELLGLSSDSSDKCLCQTDRSLLDLCLVSSLTVESPTRLQLEKP